MSRDRPLRLPMTRTRTFWRERSARSLRMKNFRRPKSSAISAAGRLTPGAIDATTLAGKLDTAGIPDPDLLIRTSGEQRVSNFLLWQCAYTEFVFTPVLWPDFDRKALEQALAEFGARTRRFGGL